MSLALTVARPYAKAAFAIAGQRQAVPAWSEWLATSAKIAEDRRVQSLLRHPNVTLEQRLKLFNDLAKTQTSGVDGAENFLRLLAVNNRITLLSTISQLFEHYRDKANHIQPVEVTSAFSLTEPQTQQLMTALKKRVGSDVRLESKVDKKLLGGAVIRIGDRVIDGSLRGKLHQLADRLTV